LEVPCSDAYFVFIDSKEAWILYKQDTELIVTMAEITNEKVYLDINIFREWFIRTIKNNITPIFYVQFLSEHGEIEKRISVFSIAELVETLLKEPKLQGWNLTKEWILSLIEIFRDTVGVKIIEEDETSKGQYTGFVVSPKIVEFTYLCGDLKDSVHVDIAKSNDLLFITKDDEAGRVKTAYPKVEGIRSLIRRYEKKGK